MSFEESLRLALGNALPHDLPEGVWRSLEALDRVLVRWSAKLDLIGFRTEGERIARYYAEPLAAARWLPREGRGLDIGSGGGSPGLPFAIATPSMTWTFLEPRRRRRLFLEEAVRELRIRNVRVSAERFDAAFSGRTEGRLAVVSSRGVRFRRAEVASIAATLVPGGRFLWWVGNPGESLGDLGLSVTGPFPLVAGSRARLLVVTRERGCFT